VRSHFHPTSLRDFRCVESEFATQMANVNCKTLWTFFEKWKISDETPRRRGYSSFFTASFTVATISRCSLIGTSKFPITLISSASWI